MKRLRLPKWGTILGGLLALAYPVAQVIPQLQQASPALAHMNTLTAIASIAGTLVAIYGTPPHATEPDGGVHINAT